MGQREIRRIIRVGGLPQLVNAPCGSLMTAMGRLLKTPLDEATMRRSLALNGLMLGKSARL